MTIKPFRPINSNHAVPDFELIVASIVIAQ
ncbi:MAG: hypothetical protein ACI9LX_002258 [Paraglaciecola sp.]|jgi:hypothetical protein